MMNILNDSDTTAVLNEVVNHENQAINNGTHNQNNKESSYIIEKAINNDENVVNKRTKSTTTTISSSRITKQKSELLPSPPLSLPQSLVSTLVPKTTTTTTTSIVASKPLKFSDINGSIDKNNERGVDGFKHTTATTTIMPNTLIFATSNTITKDNNNKAIKGGDKMNVPNQKIDEITSLHNNKTKFNSLNYQINGDNNNNNDSKDNDENKRNRNNIDYLIFPFKSPSSSTASVLTSSSLPFSENCSTSKSIKEYIETNNNLSNINFHVKFNNLLSKSNQYNNSDNENVLLIDKYRINRPHYNHHHHHQNQSIKINHEHEKFTLQQNPKFMATINKICLDASKLTSSSSSSSKFSSSSMSSVSVSSGSVSSLLKQKEDLKIQYAVKKFLESLNRKTNLQHKNSEKTIKLSSKNLNVYTDDDDKLKLNLNRNSINNSSNLKSNVSRIVSKNVSMCKNETKNHCNESILISSSSITSENNLSPRRSENLMDYRNLSDGSKFGIGEGHDSENINSLNLIEKSSDTEVYQKDEGDNLSEGEILSLGEIQDNNN